ncbi:MAG TPA: hypothetical protein DDZ66_06035, partial [Firmicutes bacterium]|nr:hypothetical protein [Bacillota bacterium]
MSGGDHMLHQLVLENFKAFKKPAKVPMAPITLIFGENSSGKSSILQSLSLLKQSWEQREGDRILLFRPRHPTVDLVGFKDVVYGQNPNVPITFSLQISDQDTSHWLEFEFVAEEVSRQQGLLQKIWLLGNNGQRLARWVSAEEVNDLRAFNAEDNTRLSNLFLLDWLTKSKPYWQKSYDLFMKGWLANGPWDFPHDAELIPYDKKTGCLHCDLDLYGGIPVAVFPVKPYGDFSLEDYIDWVDVCTDLSIIKFDGILPTSVDGRDRVPALEGVDPVTLVTRAGSSFGRF